ncbi:MAG: carboxypeptidase-like regulatory domain-containing protein [Myxococcaceae bacterium]|nr:carboxypeptidase-like regulatory domain-containing protein [Myxococcaceae bacterium]
MSHRLRWVLASAVLALLGCGNDRLTQLQEPPVTGEPVTMDPGVEFKEKDGRVDADAGQPDSGQPQMNPVDAGGVDGGKVDAGAMVTDAGTVDGGVLDAGIPQPGTGTVSGKLCAVAGQWLSGATVTFGSASTTTNAQGEFTLTNLPPGMQVLHVTRGAFSMDLTVEVKDGQVTQLPAPACLPLTTKMAVITGEWDHVETLLTSLGFKIGARYGEAGKTTVDPMGTIDIIEGTDKPYWLYTFLNDPLWMSQYAIILFNCAWFDDIREPGGVNRIWFDPKAGTAMTHLATYVNNGGSVYASDWANVIVNRAFPNRIKWRGACGRGNGRCGVKKLSLGATVNDSGLAAKLGKSSVTVAMDQEEWVVPDPNGQPADVTVFLTAANAQYWVNGEDDGSGVIRQYPEDIHNVPLVLRFTHGQGRVLFTSVHEGQYATQDLKDILKYLVFAL